MSTDQPPSKLSTLLPGCGCAFIVVVAAASISVVGLAAYLVFQLVTERSKPTATVAAPTPLKISPTTSPAPDPAVTASPKARPGSGTVGINASQDHPWQNSLGMKFVPVLGTRVLFAIWDTRVQDFQQFVAETGYQVAGEMWSLGTSMVDRRKERTGTNPALFKDLHTQSLGLIGLTQKRFARG
jgi:hypothetical protein